MLTFKEIAPLVQYLNSKKRAGCSAGFVPTMGALHQGHLKLISRSVKDNDLTVCSIFVNPTQFNNQEDLAKYPRTLESDLELLEKHGCDVVFIPDASTMYLNERIVNFDFGYLEKIMEGKFRPGHFKGVGIVIAKLFNIINPEKAYFGTKDLQQLVVIKKLVTELNFHIQVVPVETEREGSGLAMSSRNERLSPTERQEAIIFYKSLKKAQEMLMKGQNIQTVKDVIALDFQKKENIDLEYFEVADSDSLLPVTNINGKDNVSLCIAGYVGKVRLIDNISLF